MKMVVCGRTSAMARACAMWSLALGLMLGGCDEDGDRMDVGDAGDAGDGPSTVEHEGECGTAELMLSGAQEGPVTVGSGGLVSSGTCVHGFIGDDAVAPSLHCIFHTPGDDDFVLGQQFSFHINDFEWGSRSWTIEDPASDDMPYDGIVRYFDYDENAEAIAWVTGLEGGRCTIALSRSSEDGVEGGVSCESLHGGYGDPALELDGTFCVESQLILEAEN